MSEIFDEMLQVGNVPNVKDFVHVQTLIRHCLLCKTSMCLILIRYERDSTIVQDIPYL
jgi:hypothetical protein